VSDHEQLQWEARFGRPAAAAAFVAAVMLIAGTVILQTMLDDRRGVEPLADFLLSVDESPSSLILQSVVQAIGALCLIPVFYYLFRATTHRVPQIPRWFVYIILLGPLLYAVSQVFGAVERIDVAEMFADENYTFDDPDPERLADECPAIRGEVGDDCAEELLQQNANLGAALPSLVGSVLVAFMFVMVPLRARRAGLMSSFMSILGVIAGVLLVLQLAPPMPIVIQAFWLGAIGLLYLGAWPGGRGPAWESGEPDPWPSAAERRGLGTPRDGDASEPEPKPDAPGPPTAPAEPEPVPERPSSRKRRRKPSQHDPSV
jgi:hypothetical protein